MHGNALGLPHASTAAPSLGGGARLRRPTGPSGAGSGEVGTAAERATYSVTPRGTRRRRAVQAVDSGYLATIADVGFVGLAVLLALFARLLVLAQRAIRAGSTPGWLAPRCSR